MPAVDMGGGCSVVSRRGVARDERIGYADGTVVAARAVIALRAILLQLIQSVVPGMPIFGTAFGANGLKSAAVVALCIPDRTRSLDVIGRERVIFALHRSPRRRRHSHH